MKLQLVRISCKYGGFPAKILPKTLILKSIIPFCRGTPESYKFVFRRLMIEFGKKPEIERIKKLL